MILPHRPPTVKYHLVMSPIDAIKLDLQNYAKFTGRSARPEFWWWVLASAVIGALLSFSRVLSDLFSLATLVPTFAVTVRRFHDVGKSGWWAISGLVVGVITAILVFVLGILAVLLPLAWFVVMLVWLVQPGTSGENKYGAQSSTI